MEEDLSSVLQDSLQFISIIFNKIKAATEQDTILQQTIAYTLSSWPATVADPELKPFFSRRKALSVIQ